MWYYASNGQRLGPLSPERFQELLRLGVILPETLVWRAGMTNWMPAGQVSSEADTEVVVPVVPSPPGPGQIACPECREPALPDELVPVAHTHTCPRCLPYLAQRLREGGSLRLRPFQLGSLRTRGYARLIDTVICAFLGNTVSTVLLMGVSLLVDFLDVSVASTLAFFVMLGVPQLCSAAYYILFTWAPGLRATPGKLIFGLQVVRADGGGLTLAQATIWYLGTLLSLLAVYLGFAMAYLDEELRTLHDRLAGTRVILRQSQRQSQNYPVLPPPTFPRSAWENTAEVAAQ